MAGCANCDLIEDCDIRKFYLKAEKYYKNGDIEGLREVSNLIELHEQYIVEMRRDINHKLIELIQNRRK